ncbi:unnamed protein product [Rotaria socialis]
MVHIQKDMFQSIRVVRISRRALFDEQYKVESQFRKQKHNIYHFSSEVTLFECLRYITDGRSSSITASNIRRDQLPLRGLNQILKEDSVCTGTKTCQWSCIYLVIIITFILAVMILVIYGIVTISTKHIITTSTGMNIGDSY